MLPREAARSNHGVAARVVGWSRQGCGIGMLRARRPRPAVVAFNPIWAAVFRPSPLARSCWRHSITRAAGAVGSAASDT